MNIKYTDEFWGLDYPPTPQPDWLFEDLNLSSWELYDDKLCESPQDKRAKLFVNTDNSLINDLIIDIGADIRVKSNDLEDDDPDFPEQDYTDESDIPEELQKGYVDEILLLAMQEQDNINAMIKGYPTPNYG